MNCISKPEKPAQTKCLIRPSFPIYPANPILPKSCLSHLFRSFANFRVRQIVEWKMVELENYYRYFNRLLSTKY